MKNFLNGKVFLLTACLLCFICASVLGSVFFFSRTETTKVATTSTSRLSVQENVIPIAMAADDNYTYPTLVAITSLMENSKKDTHYDIYIMTPGEFAEENSQKLLNLQDKYCKRCKISLIDMKDRYKDANDKGHITTPTYYRLSLSSLLPSLNKIIWLDGDTLTFEDLTDMFDLDMNDLYYRGFLNRINPGTKFFVKEDAQHICAGVMLINLEKLRQDKMEEKFETFIRENNDRLVQHDQTVINVLCHKNIGALPPKYGVFSFSDENTAKLFEHELPPWNRYTDKEIVKAYRKPAILHCVKKPWDNPSWSRADLWWDYAEKTGYLAEIKAKYQIS